jgi:predicted  nucleic acid-binding Zn-ribbon protein
MFNAVLKKELVKIKRKLEVTELDVASEADKVDKLKKEIAELELKKRMEEQEIKHLVKMEREKNALDLEKGRVKIEGEAIKTQMDQLTAHHESLLKTIREHHQETKDLIWKEIIKRLPNVNMEIKETR